MKTLVVDDSSPIRMILGRMLRDKGHDIFEAKDGQEALSQLEAQKDISLIMLDWNMPIMTGMEFLDAFGGKSWPGQRPLIIMVTTENDMSKIAEAMEKGANEYIMKPFTKEILDEKLSILGLQEGTHA